MKTLRVVILAIVVAFFIVFVLQNNENVEIRYFTVLSSPLPLWLVVFITLFVGLLIGWLFSYLSEVELRRSLKKKNKESEELKKEVEYLRNLPIVEKSEQKEKETEIEADVD
ncbi:MAG: lipopolysaccharide assembly protein LapA domain-containing protein [Campylobacterota bacterium]|nr:lipopolysaccharide assembly protein LapA domain-containing protein [Campylobacterota bacterium]